jgi:hypothetical protein
LTSAYAATPWPDNRSPHGIQLPFDGKLSDTEQRLLEQFAFEP